MTNYTVRFDRGHRGWTCAAYSLGADGRTAGPAIVSGTGTTKDDARNAALALTVDQEIRAALANADHRRPHWIQGALGEQLEAQRKAAAQAVTRRPVRPARP